MESKMTDSSNENKNEIIKIDNKGNGCTEKQDPSQNFNNDKAYSDIFKEMLYLENLRSLKDKTKFCLIRLWINNLDEVINLLDFDSEDDFLSEFSGILTNNLRSTDVYLKTQESNFLMLFLGTTIDDIKLALKRIESIILKKFNTKIEVEWRVMKASDKEEDITPLINKKDLENKTRSNSITKGHERVILRRFGLKSMFKNFIISYLIFFGIILIIGIIIYFTEQRFSFIPQELKFGVILGSLNLGFLNNFNSNTATLIFFALAGLIFSVIFGLFGVLVGWIINIGLRLSGGIEINTQSKMKKSGSLK
jgi:GGDEF domain-containing protein